MRGPTALDILLVILHLPAAAPAAVLGGIIFVPPTPETREQRWAAGFFLAGVAAIGYHLGASPEGWRVWIAPSIGVGIAARILLERRARAAREANARERAARDGALIPVEPPRPPAP